MRPQPPLNPLNQHPATIKATHHPNPFQQNDAPPADEVDREGKPPQYATPSEHPKAKRRHDTLATLPRCTEGRVMAPDPHTSHLPTTPARHPDDQPLPVRQYMAAMTRN
ncbi:hypothetical protein GCM10010522_73390 [Kribbella solani]